ncbi:MAG: deoxyribonuclease IV [Bacilli bacterium]|nr:deoxyribonuclease IV [Bacilli bacterium]
MLIIGSHVSFTKEKGLLGSLEEALSYGANTFMFYTGAPQNTRRFKIDEKLTQKAYELMKENGIDINNLIVHAPYIVNLANNKEEDKYQFSINFLKEETKRCETLGVKYMVLHPGSSVGLDKDIALSNIINGLNIILKDSNTTILLEIMAGKGTEVGRDFSEIKTIIDGVIYKDKIGVCLDTCHINDAGYDLNDFDKVLNEFDNIIGLKFLKCVHVNDSKNEIGAHKDRHENIGYGTIGFDNLIKIIYHEKLDNIPKILETPYINGIAPYKEEIEMIRNRRFNDKLK